jgi:hypothetical protein
MSDGGQQGELTIYVNQSFGIRWDIRDSESGKAAYFEIMDAIDRARASFPNPRFSDRNCVEREKAVLDWFNKWFGESKPV